MNDILNFALPAAAASEEGILDSIEFQMSLLMFVALAGYLIAYRINQSAVVGIILAGIVVGPSVLGLVTENNDDFVASLGHLGAVILLFTIGLHFNIRDITKGKYFLIAAVGVIVPWIAGYAIAKPFGFDNDASIFIGTALTATSIAITANVLKEMGKLETNAAQAIIGAAVIDDVLSLLALTISEEAVSGGISAGPVLITIVKAIGFLVVGVLAGRLIIRRLMWRMDRTSLCNKYPESIFIMAMMVAFLYSLMAELMGLSAIIGSFLAGVTLGQIKLKHNLAFREGAEHLQIIFASIFFISLGVLLDLSEFTLQLTWFVLALTGVALVTKLIGCGLPARLAGMNTKDSITVGLGMAPRGEVAMIVALIGFNANLISQDVYAAVVPDEPADHCHPANYNEELAVQR